MIIGAPPHWARARICGSAGMPGIAGIPGIAGMPGNCRVMKKSSPAGCAITVMSRCVLRRRETRRSTLSPGFTPWSNSTTRSAGSLATHTGPVYRHDQIAGADARLLRRSSRTDFAHTRPRITSRIVELHADENALRTRQGLDALHHRPIHLRGERCELLRRHLESAASAVHLSAQHILALSGRVLAVARCLHAQIHRYPVGLERRRRQRAPAATRRRRRPIARKRRSRCQREAKCQDSRMGSDMHSHVESLCAIMGLPRPTSPRIAPGRGS